MAEVDVQSQQKAKLKYLEFVQVGAFHAIGWFLNLYTFAKERSGSLKPGVQSVEERVKTVISPVVDKYQNLPAELLKFLDNKVDEYVAVLNVVAPPTLKKIATHVIYVIQKTPEVARSVLSTVQNSGVIDSATGLAKNVHGKSKTQAKVLYKKYEQSAEKLAVSIWCSVEKVPFFHQAAKVAVFFSDKYNQTVEYTAGKGYKVSSFLPLLPTEKISKAVSRKGEGEATGSAN